MYILVTVYNLAKATFDGVPYPSERPQAEENPSVHNSSPLQSQAALNGQTFQVREDTPWPNSIQISMNLFKARADCPIPPMQAPSVKLAKAEVPLKVGVIPCAMVLPKQIGEKCTWRPHCPICKKEQERWHGGLEWWQAERSAKKPLSTKPTTLPNLWCPWQVLRADQAKKRMGWNDGMSKWEIQF